MTASFDAAPWGTHLPSGYERAVLALTRAMPENWLGLRLAILFRRLIMGRIGEGAATPTLWGMRLRLYPRRNGCEKNALFTPQMFDTMERRVLAEARAARSAAAFTFVDIGANVGLYSLYLASCGGRAHARDRAAARNPRTAALPSCGKPCGESGGACRLRSPIATGEVTLVLNDSDSGGTHIEKHDGRHDAGERIGVPCKPLLAVFVESGITAIDALKIDVEGAEDIVLAPFLRDAPQPAAAEPDPDRGYARLLAASICSRCFAAAATLKRNAAARTWR